MRKFYTMLAFVFIAILAKAQSVPNVNFTFAPDPLTNNVVFTNTSSTLGDGVKKAYWYFGDGTSQMTGALDGATHHYSVAGTYQVCLKIYRYPTNSNDSVLIGPECKSVTLQQTCRAEFQYHDSISTNPLIHHVTFNGTGSNNANKIPLQICWNFGDGTDTCISATAGTSITPFLNIKHNYTQNGTYNVCLKIRYDGGCVAEKCLAVVLAGPTIADSCSANFTINPILATPLGRKFIAMPWHSNNKKPVRICWTFGDGKDTCIQYSTTYTGDYWVEHKYANYGQYEVCVTIKYDGGCEKRKCNQVQITQPVTTDTCYFELNEAPVSAAGLERRFYVGLMANRRAEKICWNFGDGTDTCVILSNPVNPQQLMITHHYPGPGNYQVCAKVYYVGGCVATRCRVVSISVPQNNLCGGYMSDSTISVNTIRFKGTGIQNANDYVTSYAWTFGDGTTGSGQVINHTYGSPGRYSVCLFMRTNLGCETKICKQVNVQGNSQPQLILAPSPVVNALTAIFYSLFQQTVTVKIYNANGVMVKSYVKNANVGSNTWTFTDVATLPTGVYSVIVQSPNQFATAIFFKQ